MDNFFMASVVYLTIYNMKDRRKYISYLTEFNYIGVDKELFLVCINVDWLSPLKNSRFTISSFILDLIMKTTPKS